MTHRFRDSWLCSHLPRRKWDISCSRDSLWPGSFLPSFIFADSAPHNRFQMFPDLSIPESVRLPVACTISVLESSISASEMPPSDPSGLRLNITSSEMTTRDASILPQEVGCGLYVCVLIPLMLTFSIAFSCNKPCLFPPQRRACTHNYMCSVRNKAQTDCFLD